MSSEYANKRMSTVSQAEVVAGPKPPPAKEETIGFQEKEKTELFCYRTEVSEAGVDVKSARWCRRAKAQDFIKGLPQDPWSAGKGRGDISPPYSSSFTLIGGYGNGTLFPLSLDRELFEEIMTKFRLPDTVRKVIRSIHGVLARFVEYDCGGHTSLLILLSTPKAPVRELFCAVRIIPALASVTCLLFDNLRADVDRIANLVRCGPSTTGTGTGTGMGTGAPAAWKNPAALLALLIRECGDASERKRSLLDKDVLGAEVHTKSTPWQDPGRSLVRWPDDFYETTSVLHLCQNSLMFVARAVDFEIDAWRRLRRMAEDERLGPWLRAAAGEGEWAAVLDGVEFEIAHTLNRKAQVECLKDRVEVQINLINNLIAHRETSQSNLIAVLALIFAPASLVASIFSAGIFALDGSSWVSYVASTVPVTLVTVVVGLSFLEQQKLMRVWRELGSFVGRAGEKQSRDVGDCCLLLV